MKNKDWRLRLTSAFVIWTLLGVFSVATGEDTGSTNLPSRFPEMFSDTSPIRNSAQIVFSGHSLTDVAIPTIISIAKSKNIDLKSIYQSVPGSTIRYRTEGTPESGQWGGYGLGLPKGINLINEFDNPSTLPDKKKYDILVVTERHDILGTVRWESTLESLYHFHNRLLESSTNGQTYFYQSWLDIDKSNPDPWIEYEMNSLTTWECITSKTNLTLSSQQLPQNVRTVGAGWALAQMVKEALNNNIPGLSGDQKNILDQIFSDNVHLTPLGSFFVGAYTFGEIFNQTPEGAKIPREIPIETGSFLLQMAWSYVKEYRGRADNGVHNMTGCRQHISENICLPFWTYFSDRPEAVEDCRVFFGSDNPENPFRWPDPNLNILASPQ